MWSSWWRCCLGHSKNSSDDDDDDDDDDDNDGCETRPVGPILPDRLAQFLTLDSVVFLSV